jgi:hypothetical protein
MVIACNWWDCKEKSLKLTKHLKHGEIQNIQSWLSNSFFPPKSTTGPLTLTDTCTSEIALGHLVIQFQTAARSTDTVTRDAQKMNNTNTPIPDKIDHKKDSHRSEL